MKIGTIIETSSVTRLPTPDLRPNTLAGKVGSPNPKTYEALAWACHVISKGADHFGSRLGHLQRVTEPGYSTFESKRRVAFAGAALKASEQTSTG